MFRFAVLALLTGALSACGNGSKSQADQQKSTTPTTGGATTGSPEKIEVPGTKGGPEGAAGSAVAGADDPTKLSDATKQRAQNPMFNLKPEEGTLTITKAEGKAGAPGKAEIKLAPGSGYHVATDYPIKLWLEAPSGVKVDKTFLSAGGRNKSQGDAATLSEQALAFAVNATPEKAGTFEIQGVFSFGICEKDSCHPRTQPITIQVAAN